jgi:hypothetical protein
MFISEEEGSSREQEASWPQNKRRKEFSQEDSDLEPE